MKDNGTRNRDALGSSARSSAGEYRDVGSGAGPAWRLTGTTSWQEDGNCGDLDVSPGFCQTPCHAIATSNRFRHDFGLRGPVPAEKRFLINKSLVTQGTEPWQRPQ